MLRKFSAWTHLWNFDQSQHKNWTYSVTNPWPGNKRSTPPVFLKSWLSFRVWGEFEIKILTVRGQSDKNTTHFVWIMGKKRTWTCDHLKLLICQRITSKKYSTSMGRHLSPRFGQVILVSGDPVLTAVNWSQHWCAISLSLELPN